MSGLEPIFSRDRLLAGSGARRATLLLFAIEAESARLVAASRINRAGFVGDRTAAERERQFLAAVSLGRDLPSPPTIRDIERFADEWASLLPADPSTRMGLAHLLGEKYRFRRTDVPRIAARLGVDEPDAAQTFERIYQAPISSIYAAQLPVRAQAAWAFARLAARFDRLPVFWIAFFLALTEVLGEGVMSVPLAMAGIGPLPGVIVILIFGVVNLLTMAAMAESVIRDGSMRYGLSYFGRLVTDLLGRVPSSVVGVVFAIDTLLALWFYALGFASVLAGATGVPMGVWIALLILANVLILRKETLDDTIASAVISGLTILAILVAIVAIALANVNPSNLGYANLPIIGGGALNVATVGLIFGVLMMALFGHASAANSAKVVLTIEPSGRSLLWGNLAAIAAATVIYCIATFAIIGVVGSAPLLATTGTALTPLADRLGPVVSVLSAAYALVAIGVGSLYCTLATYNQVVEILPRPRDVAAGWRAWLARQTSTRRGRLTAGFAPTVLLAVALEIAVLAGRDNFADVVAFTGALTAPLLTVIVPLLMVLAARRRAEYVPGAIIRLAGNPVTVWVGIVLFTLAVAAHAWIWDNSIERVTALGTAALMVALVAWSLRGGILRRRAVVEVRADERAGRTLVSVTGAGSAIVRDGVLGDLEVRAAEANLPAGHWHELRLWLHRVTTDGRSIEIDGSASIESARGQEDVGVPALGGPVVVDVDGSPLTVRISGLGG
jgi:amino acid permease